MPKVSVIIPTYNYGKYIEKAIDSVLAQTCRGFEIIVVDDGSTDNTKEIIDKNYKRKVCYYYQENKGAPSARNYGLSNSRGEYVVFLDADDWLMKNALQSRYDFLQSNSGCGWVYGTALYQNEAGQDISQFFSNRFASSKKREGYILSYLLLGELIPLCSVMLKRKLVQELGGFATNLSYFQDYELWLRVAAHSKIGFIEECNVVIVTHTGSISQSEGDEYQSYLQILNNAEIRFPKVIDSLGYSWQKRLSLIMAERARHFFNKGEHKSGLTLFFKAIKCYPWYLRHYVAFARYMVRSLKQ
jgi:glycosyltransferase involved in cell wall biosynthesis